SWGGTNANEPGSALNPIAEIQSRACACCSSHVGSVAEVIGVTSFALFGSEVRNEDIGNYLEGRRYSAPSWICEPTSFATARCQIAAAAATSLIAVPAAASTRVSCVHS